MSDKIITFAKNLTVGVKGYKDLSTENPELSFMTPNTEDAAYQKRLATLNGWCNISRTYNYVTKQYEKVTQNDNLHSLENSPTTGFRIMNATSRYSTDNKFFRLIDPRGYILEISTGNLEVILQTSDILKGGYIAEPCVWGRQGNNNVLVAVSSEAYAKSVKFADQNTTKFADLTIGDIVKFKDGSEDIFLGEYQVISTKCNELTPPSSRATSWWGQTRQPSRYTYAIQKVEKLYAFKSTSGSSINLVRKLKPCVKIGTSTEQIQDFYKYENSMYIRMPTNDYSKSVQGIVKAGINIKDTNIMLDLTEKENKENNKNSQEYVVISESGVMIETYMSSFYYGSLENSYNEIIYSPMDTKGYTTLERNLNKNEPVKLTDCMIVQGLKLIADTDSGKFEMSGNL